MNSTMSMPVLAVAPGAAAPAAIGAGDVSPPGSEIFAQLLLALGLPDVAAQVETPALPEVMKSLDPAAIELVTTQTPAPQETLPAEPAPVVAVYTALTAWLASAQPAPQDVPAAHSAPAAHATPILPTIASEAGARTDLPAGVRTATRPIDVLPGTHAPIASADPRPSRDSKAGMHEIAAPARAVFSPEPATATAHAPAATVSEAKREFERPATRTGVQPIETVAVNMSPFAAQPAHAQRPVDANVSPLLQLTAPLDSPEFAPALALTLSHLARDGVQEARLQLQPAEMGPIDVRIALDGARAHVEFRADMAATRSAIEAGLPELAGALREAGLTLAGGGVFQQRRRDPGAPSSEPGEAHAERSDELAPAVMPARRAALGRVDLYA